MSILKSRRASTLRTMVVSIGLLLGTLGVGIASSTPAGAMTTGSPSHVSYLWANHGDIPFKSCPSNTCATVGTVYGQGNYPVYMLCWTDNQWAYGNYWTNRWFYVYLPLWGGHYGFVTASYVYNQAASPHC